MPRWSGLVATAAVTAARAAWRALPSAAKGRLEARFFGAVKHATRVTNDGYPQPSEVIPRGGPHPQGTHKPDTSL